MWPSPKLGSTGFHWFRFRQIVESRSGICQSLLLEYSCPFFLHRNYYTSFKATLQSYFLCEPLLIHAPDRTCYFLLWVLTIFCLLNPFSHFIIMICLYLFFFFLICLLSSLNYEILKNRYYFLLISIFIVTQNIDRRCHIKSNICSIELYSVEKRKP